MARTELKTLWTCAKSLKPTKAWTFSSTCYWVSSAEFFSSFSEAKCLNLEARSQTKIQATLMIWRITSKREKALSRVLKDGRPRPLSRKSLSWASYIANATKTLKKSYKTIKMLKTVLKVLINTKWATWVYLVGLVIWEIETCNY